MTNPLLSLAVLDTNDAKHRPYCAQIRSQGACGAFYFGFCRDRIKRACGSLSASSNPAPGIRSVSGRGGSDASGSWGAAPSVFWFLLYAQKERPGGEPYRLCTLQNQRDAVRRPQTFPRRAGKIKLYYGFCHQSLRHGCAVPPPFTQGRLWVGAMPLRYPYTWVAFGCAGRRDGAKS